MKIEYMTHPELCEVAMIHVGLIGGPSNLPPILGVVTTNDQHKADISLIQISDSVVQVQGQGIDLLVSVQCNVLGSLLESVFHCVVAPTFVPGLIGVDWEDVCSLLAAGRNGHLLAVEIEQGTDIEQLVSDVARPLQGQLRAILCCCYLPYGKFFGSSIEALNRLLQGLEAITGDFVIGVPIVTTTPPMLSLMLITD